MPHISILRCGFRQRAASLHPRPLTPPPPWAQRVIGHEELSIALHNHLPPEMVYERELLILPAVTSRQRFELALV